MKTSLASNLIWSLAGKHKLSRTSTLEHLHQQTPTFESTNHHHDACPMDETAFVITSVRFMPVLKLSSLLRGAHLEKGMPPACSGARPALGSSPGQMHRPAQVASSDLRPREWRDKMAACHRRSRQLPGPHCPGGSRLPLGFLFWPPPPRRCRCGRSAVCGRPRGLPSDCCGLPAHRAAARKLLSRQARRCCCCGSAGRQSALPVLAHHPA
jgi:hypothetical protein